MTTWMARTFIACAAIALVGGCAADAPAVPDLLVQDVPGYTLDASANPSVLAGMCGAHDALEKLGTVEKQLAFTRDHGEAVTFVRVAVPDDQAWAAVAAGIDQCAPEDETSLAGTVATRSTDEVKLENGPDAGDDRRWYSRSWNFEDTAGYTDISGTQHGVVVATRGYVLALSAPTQADVEKYLATVLD